MFSPIFVLVFCVWCLFGAYSLDYDFKVTDLNKLKLICFGPIVWVIYLFKTKGINMFKKNSIDGALEQKVKVEDMEKKIEEMKKVRDKLKSKAKEDLKWIMED